MEVGLPAYLAPLSRPMIEQVTQSLDIPSLTEGFEQLLDIFKNTRATVYDLMEPAVEQENLSTPWLISQLAELSPKRRKISKETISRWRENGLLAYQAYNKPNPDSVAALLTLRILAGPQKIAKWTPSAIGKEEPMWWCWRQDGPFDPIVPQAIPLSDDVPAHALLWTQWRGAAWQSEWLPVGTLGAARWAGIRTEKNTLIWNISEKDLQRWDPTITPLGEGIIEHAPLTLHTLATLALLRAATARLQDLPPS